MFITLKGCFEEKHARRRRLPFIFFLLAVVRGEFEPAPMECGYYGCHGFGQPVSMS